MHIEFYLYNFFLEMLIELTSSGRIFFSFIGSRAIVSGPAGGVVGYAVTTYHRETQLPVIGFDMGGTVKSFGRTNVSF